MKLGWCSSLEEVPQDNLNPAKLLENEESQKPLRGLFYSRRMKGGAGDSESPWSCGAYTILGAPEDPVVRICRG